MTNESAKIAREIYDQSHSETNKRYFLQIFRPLSDQVHDQVSREVIGKLELEIILSIPINRLSLVQRGSV